MSDAKEHNTENLESASTTWTRGAVEYSEGDLSSPQNTTSIPYPSPYDTTGNAGDSSPFDTGSRAHAYQSDSSGATPSQSKDKPTQATSKQRRSWRLRTFLGTLIIVQVVLAVGVTWALSAATSARAVSDLITVSEVAKRDSTVQIQREIVSKVTLSVQDYITKPSLVANLLKDMLVGGALQLTPGTMTHEEHWHILKNFFISLIKAFDITNIYLGGKDVYWISQRANSVDGEDPKLLWGSIQDVDGKLLNGWYSWDVDWKTQDVDLASKVNAWEGYQPHLRPWFTASRDAYNRGETDLSWTDPYLWQGAPPFRLVLGLSATRPVRVGGPDGIIVAAGGDFTLAWVSQLLKTQDLEWSPSGLIYLVERKGANAGNLIATNVGEPWTLETEDPTCTTDDVLDGSTCGTFVRLSATKSPVDLLRVTATSILEAWGGSWSQENPDGNLILHVEPAGAILVTTQLVKDDFGLEWILVIAIPENDIMGEINKKSDDTYRNIRTMNTVQGLVLGAFLIFAILAAWLLSNRISKPMRRLEKGMSEMKNLEFIDQETGSDSSVTEISSMQNTYMRLQRALKNFQVFLPPEVVNRIVRGESRAASLHIRQLECVLMKQEIITMQAGPQLDLPALLALLQVYLTNISSVIADHSGVVCDFDGDQVLSVWSDGHQLLDQVLQSCEAALEAAERFRTEVKPIYEEFSYKAWEKAKLAEKGSGSSSTSSSRSSKRKLLAKPKPPIFTTSIHCGRGLEGNIGSPQLMKYDIVGDLRTASTHLMNQARHFERPIILSHAVFTLVRERYFCYPVGLIPASSMSSDDGDEVTVYELVGLHDSLPPAQASFYNDYVQAFEAYQRGHAARALDILEKLLDTDPTFAPARVMIRKCRKMALSLRGEGMSSEIQILKVKDIDFVKSIGFGGYSEVFLARWQGVEIAVKKMKISIRDRQVDNPAQMEAWRRELLLWSKLRHPNIVFLIGEIYSEDWLGIATEYLPGGTLQQLYRRLKSKGRRISSRLRLNLCKDIAAGMNYLHTREPKIIHRDLKSSNVLLDDQNRAKVADFGISKEVTGSINFTATGTPHWMAPEVIRSGVDKAEYDESSDVYSFGMLVWEIVQSATPWGTEEVVPLLSKLVANPDLRPPLPAGLDSRWERLITSCWATNAKDRPTFEGVISYLNTNFHDIEEGTVDTASSRATDTARSGNSRGTSRSLGSLGSAGSPMGTSGATRGRAGSRSDLASDDGTPPSSVHNGGVASPHAPGGSSRGGLSAESPLANMDMRRRIPPRAPRIATAPLRFNHDLARASNYDRDEAARSDGARRVEFDDLDLIIDGAGTAEYIVGKAGSQQGANPEDVPKLNADLDGLEASINDIEATLSSPDGNRQPDKKEAWGSRVQSEKEPTSSSSGLSASDLAMVSRGEKGEVTDSPSSHRSKGLSSL